MGYHRAGFDVFGVDNAPKPLRHYPFPHVCADALEYVAEHGREFDAIHASPPCQYYSRLRHLPWLRDKVYWRSIPPTRAALVKSGKPYIIENVEDAGWDMPESIILCGQMFQMPIFRHRRFEAAFLMLRPHHQKHDGVIAPGRASLGKRHHGLGSTWGQINKWNGVGGHQAGIALHRENMGIDWMTGDELAQAIPPAYTTFIGTQLMAYLRGAK